MGTGLALLAKEHGRRFMWLFGLFSLHLLFVGEIGIFGGNIVNKPPNINMMRISIKLNKVKINNGVEDDDILLSYMM